MRNKRKNLKKTLKIRKILNYQAVKKIQAMNNLKEVLLKY